MSYKTCCGRVNQPISPTNISSSCTPAVTVVKYEECFWTHRVASFIYRQCSMLHLSNSGLDESIQDAPQIANYKFLYV